MDSSGVKIDHSPGKGRGLRATRPFGLDEVILIEKPLVALQLPLAPPRPSCCSFCWAYLGPLGTYLQEVYSVAAPDRVEIAEALPEKIVSGSKLFLSSAFFPSLPPSIECPSCEARYCSAACRQAAAVQYHRLLCSHSKDVISAASDPHAELANCAHEQPRFLLAAQFFALLISSDSAVAGEAREAFRDAVKVPWTELVSSREPAATAAAVRSLVSRAFGATRRLIAANGGDCKGTEAEYDLLLGLLDLNCTNLGLLSPMQRYLGLLYRAKATKALDAYALGASVLGGEPEIECEGAAFFRLHSCLNHSCAPNAHVKIDVESERVQVVVRALRAIEPGEELCISYLRDNDWEMSVRQAFLRSCYLFTCSCSRCSQESKAP